MGIISIWAGGGAGSLAVEKCILRNLEKFSFYLDNILAMFTLLSAHFISKVFTFKIFNEKETHLGLPVIIKSLVKSRY